MMTPNRFLLISAILLTASFFLIYDIYYQKKEPIKENSISIAFGSCSDEDKEQKLWKDIIKEKADIWIWLGDNIYGDSEDPKVLQEKYNKQKAHPDYQTMVSQMKIHGIWDDHDYGVNDGGKEFPSKVGSQKALLDFLDVSHDDIRRSRAGIYYDELIKSGDLKIHMIFLDTRYFRDNLKKAKGENIANLEGTILGSTQWEWFEDKLLNTESDLNLIASSIQAIPEEHRFEKWSNFPLERARLFDLLSKDQVQHNIIISGDRHIGEISSIDHHDTEIIDITSSSLTHGWRNERQEFNKHRHGTIVYNENYGLLKIDKTEGKTSYSGFIKSGFDKTESKINTYE